MFQDILLDCLSELAVILPLLFLTYLLLEYIEHKAGPKMERVIRKAGHWGPLWGAALGLIPQCGFSSVAASCYAGRLVSAGTLAAVFLATSDEMLPLLLSAGAPIATILRLLGLKFLIGLAAGFFIDLFWRSKELDPAQISHICTDEHCGCHQHGIFRAALSHSVKISLFIFLVSVVLQLIMANSGLDSFNGLDKPLLEVLVATTLGLIPNCSASVLITQLYIDGLFCSGAVLAGLLVNAGVGFLVLYRTNRHWKENLTITGLLYLISLLAGWAVEALGLVF